MYIPRQKSTSIVNAILKPLQERDSLTGRIKLTKKAFKYNGRDSMLKYSDAMVGKVMCRFYC